MSKIFIIKTRIAKDVAIFTLLCLLTVCGLSLACSVAADEKNVQINEEVPIKKNYSPLLLVVVGGVIGISGSIGGGTIVFMLQSRNERKIFMRSKLEELIALAYQCDDWINQLLLGYLVQGDINAIFEKFPVNRMKMLQVRYFPTLKEEVQTLDTAVRQFRELVILESKNLAASHQYSDDFRKKYDHKQTAVLKAIEGLAQKASVVKI